VNRNKCYHKCAALMPFSHCAPSSNLVGSKSIGRHGQAEKPTSMSQALRLPERLATRVGRVEDWRGSPQGLPWLCPEFPLSCSFKDGQSPVSSPRLFLYRGAVKLDTPRQVVALLRREGLFLSEAIM